LDTPVLGRRDIFLKPMSGPLIIEEYDSTCLVLPGYSASVDENAIIDIRVEQ
jgi:N-methylhydantoinase A